MMDHKFEETKNKIHQMDMLKTKEMTYLYLQSEKVNKQKMKIRTKNQEIENLFFQFRNNALFIIFFSRKSFFYFNKNYFFH